MSAVCERPERDVYMGRLGGKGEQAGISVALRTHAEKVPSSSLSRGTGFYG